jgi:catechol 2,3-dioxygenase
MNTIDPATQIGAVALTVADLNRSLEFYTKVMGFAVLQQSGKDAILGVAGVPLLLLTEQIGARPWPVFATGLYHFAILVPTRADLGRWLRHFLDLGYPLPGQGDHLVSEALYLSDPDGNGIEIYRDRPRAEWHWDGNQVRMATDPVAIRGLLAEADRPAKPWTGLPSGTYLGHIHLQVGDIPKATEFYHGILGFDIVAQMPGALFVSAGGYHHHLGLNTWHSRGASPAPAGTAGLRFFTIALPSGEARDAIIARLAEAGIDSQKLGDAVAVRDPWQNRILLHQGQLGAAEAAMALSSP